MAANGGATAAGQLSQKEADIQMMLSADVHLGTKNCDYQMERYVFKRRNDGKLLSLSQLHSIYRHNALRFTDSVLIPELSNFCSFSRISIIFGFR